MKVFLSWSGPHAKKLARLLMDWLPNVIQSVQPWTSEEIGKGTRWSDEIARELEESRFGILCVDREHLASPWIHFEAGAIAKSVPGAAAGNRVVPLLLGIDESELRDPLALFQAAKLEQEDMFRLVRSLNEVQDSVLDLTRLTKAFDQWWPTLEAEISELRATTPPPLESPKHPIHESTHSSALLEEVLLLLREQRRAVTRIEQRVGRTSVSHQSSLPSGGFSVLEERDVLRRLGSPELEVHFSDNTITLTASEEPETSAIMDADAWATKEGLELKLETPDHTYYLGKRPFD